MTALKDLSNPATEFVNPEITQKVTALVQELEALPGVSVAVLVLDDKGRAPMALAGNVQGLARHMARMLPGLLVSTGLAQPCNCASCQAKRERTRGLA